jgi:hypothetical protein
MADDDFSFSIRDEALAAFAQVHSDKQQLQEALPAGIVAAAWQALLEFGAIDAPADLDLGRVEIRPINASTLALTLPIPVYGTTIMRTTIVEINERGAFDNLHDELEREAQMLLQALLSAGSSDIWPYKLPGQKPHG